MSESTPKQSPFYRATESDRYARQDLIEEYEQVNGRSLIVFWGPIEAPILAPFADAVGDAPLETPLDLMVTSFGGDAEVAMRMAYMCHANRSDFRVIVPDTAASAATLLALAAESIVMSDTSSLGPVDPQILLPTRDDYFPAKEILRVVDNLDERIKTNPEAGMMYVTLLAEIDGLIYEAAKSALERTEELVPEVLRIRQPPPTDSVIEEITGSLLGSAMHSATIVHHRAAELGLPILYTPLHAEPWNRLWRLHAQYEYQLGPSRRGNLIEGRRVSFTFRPPSA